MKRYLPLLLLLLLFASAEGDTAPDTTCSCEQWLQFSDGSVDVCTAGDQWSFDVR
jgi:hypothetical protein